MIKTVWNLTYNLFEYVFLTYVCISQLGNNEKITKDYWKRLIFRLSCANKSQVTRIGWSWCLQVMKGEIVAITHQLWLSTNSWLVSAQFSQHIALGDAVTLRCPVLCCTLLYYGASVQSKNINQICTHSDCFRNVYQVAYSNQRAPFIVRSAWSLGSASFQQILKTNLRFRTWEGIMHQKIVPSFLLLWLEM